MTDRVRGREGGETGGTGGSAFLIPFDRLPPGLAERLDSPPPVPVPPRPAATVVIVRAGPGGLEALLLRRHRGSTFVPGAYVFPGGRVDAGDGSPELVVRVDGVTPEEAAGRLDLRGAEPPAVAYYVAAVREAFEETGILVARRPDGTRPPPAARDREVESLRRALLEGSLDLAAVLDRLGVRVDGSALEYIAHWITPEPEPRRYDTRFFAATVEADTEAVVDGREIVDALWLSPEEALARFRAGRLPMIFPTVRTLESLAGVSSPRELRRRFRGRPVPTRLPRLVRRRAGVAIELPEEG